MAAEEINAKGGVKGKKIALAFEDSNGKPETACAIVEKLIETGAVKPAVQRVIPLEEAAKAHLLSETGHGRGRIVLRVSAK